MQPTRRRGTEIRVSRDCGPATRARHPRSQGSHARGLRLARCERGAAALEFAIVLPILILVIFGLIDVGRLLAAQIGVTAASREGVRALALGRTPAQVQSIIQASSPNLASLASLGKAQQLTVAQMTACPASPGPTTMATVIVRTDFSWIAPVSIISVASDRTVESSAEMLCVG